MIALMLYFSILFNSFGCGFSHEQTDEQQLLGLSGLYCSSNGSVGPAGDLDEPNTGCYLCSLFSALILAAFFWLLGFMRSAHRWPRIDSVRVPLRRYLWPSINPRASPALFPR
tara:strand:+ start:14804 stop:15142 length:339 start_codon:yes stop_codon:yes gene_type:complete